MRVAAVTVRAPIEKRIAASVTPPSPEALFREARRRRRRRWGAAGVAFLLIAAVAGAVGAGMSGTNPPNATVSTATSGVNSATAPVTPPCSATQLRPRTGDSTGYLGGAAHQLLLVDIGSPCRLAEDPTLLGVKASGVRVLLATAHGREGRRSPDYVMPTVLRRREAGEVVVSTSDVCPAITRVAGSGPTVIRRLRVANTYHVVAIVLPHKMGSVEVHGVSLQAVCPVGITALGTVPPPYGGPLGTPATLNVSMALPTSISVATVRAGEVLPYTVSLYDSTEAPVTFRNCPRYTLRMYATLPTKLDARARLGPPIAQHTAQLDCSTATVILPGEYDRFNLTLQVPRAHPGSTLGFTWTLDVPHRGQQPAGLSVGRANASAQLG